MQRVVLAVFVCALALAGSAGAAVPARVGIFFYPWFGTPAHDGGYVHWQQAGHSPPLDLASSFFPARGAYSSSDRALLGQQLDEIRSAGIDQLIVSWWGQDSPEHARMPALVEAARARGLSLAGHLEPYPGRTIVAVEADLAHLRATHGIADVYVYRPFDLPVAEWKALNARIEGMRLFAETGLAGKAAAAGFDGLYTYDVLTFGGGKLARICAQARKQRLLCAPSVGPGYDARRAGADTRVKPRRRGATYDSMWSAALRAGPDLVTITSYNEWHEGTQIEPARARRGYESYEGAWGLRGARAERAYLDRTAFWAKRLAQHVR